LLFPGRSLGSIKRADKVSHASLCTISVLQGIPQGQQALFEVLVDANEIGQEQVDSLIKEDKIVDGVPAELIFQCRAELRVNCGDLRCSLIQWIDQSLVHLFRTGLVDGEAELH